MVTAAILLGLPAGGTARADWVPFIPSYDHAFGARVSAGLDEERVSQFTGLTVDYSHSLTESLTVNLSLSQDRARSDDEEGGTRLDSTRSLNASLAYWVASRLAFGATYGKEIAFSSPETDARWEWGWGDNWVGVFTVVSFWQHRHHDIGATLSLDHDLDADYNTASLDLGYAFSF
ncbi:MAG TPA: hypothetical protein VFB95_12185 [Candidatus Cryosericum sp.]|nr:hypothetical protein [Candidatus Cryosericum sp.]